MRAHDVSDTALQEVYKSVVVGKLLYALLPGGGLRQRQTVNEWTQSFAAASVLACTAHSKLPAKSLTVLMTNYLIKSFGGITYHVLHQLLTDRVDTSYNLRSRAHSRALPEKKVHMCGVGRVADSTHFPSPSFLPFHLSLPFPAKSYSAGYLGIIPHP